MAGERDGEQGRSDVAIVTGGGSGIGAEVARQLAEDGCRVAILDRDGSAAAAVAASTGGLAIEADVVDESAVAAAVTRVEGALGPPTVLCNIAGVGSTSDVPATSLATWDTVLAVNATGTFLMCRAVLPGMVTRHRGAIVNMASVAGLVGLRERAAYCAAKGAVIALTRAMAVDHVGDGVRVNCVCPGTTDTPWVARLLDASGDPSGTRRALVARQPMGRLGTAAEVASAVSWLASDRASFATGTCLTIDGGLTAQ